MWLLHDKDRRSAFCECIIYLIWICHINYSMKNMWEHSRKWKQKGTKLVLHVVVYILVIVYHTGHFSLLWCISNKKIFLIFVHWDLIQICPLFGILSIIVLLFMQIIKITHILWVQSVTFKMLFKMYAGLCKLNYVSFFGCFGVFLGSVFFLCWTEQSVLFFGWSVLISVVFSSWTVLVSVVFSYALF